MPRSSVITVSTIRSPDDRCELTQAVNNLKEPLSDAVAEAIKQDFASPAADADLKALNEEFLKKHSQSSEHLRRGYNVRYLIDPSSKSQNESDTQKLADSSPSIAEAVAGLGLLQSWKSDEKTVEAYREVAAKRWPEATVFQK